MEATKIENVISVLGYRISPEDKALLRKALVNADDSKSIRLKTLSLKDPTITLILSIFFCAFDRFYLGDMITGVLKLVTCGGCFIWIILDVISAKRRTYEKNLDIIMQNI